MNRQYVNVGIIKLMLCVLFFFTGLNISAQEQKWGVSLGTSYNRLFTDNAAREGLHLGAVVGAYYQRILTEDFWFRLEVNYAGLGGNLIFEEWEEQSADLSLRFHAIQIPLLLAHQTDAGFYLFAGPYVGRNIAINATLNSGELDQFDSFSAENFNGTDYGVLMGFGWSFDAGIQLSLRLSTGMREMETPAVRPSLRGTKHTNIQFLIGLNF